MAGSCTKLRGAADRRVGGRRKLHAHVDDDDVGGRLPGQDVDGRATAREVEHHLPGDLLRVGAHPFLRHAVVSAHHDDRLARHGRIGHAASGGDPAGEVLELPEAPARLGLEVQGSPRLLTDARIDGDEGPQSSKLDHACHASTRDLPAA
jgi:hypothetical protein